ncbi:NAD(P)-dependent oxidoreductase [Hyalangium sp.]|uniref:NAD(P)-dependent oxidoreductase n=1 Tax=Hyalangium sp. TaxID=2028555 RepID=UPI002D5714D8|nr:NAD(P)H-binding protein [Hyalangium sp.]HYI01855.1 NAD(P)H-binding protein [Hyalangium sp.]
MNVLLLGATGFTGRAILDELLMRGHAVTALVRNPDALSVAHERLKKVKGDALDRAAVAGGLAGQDGVIQALGLGKPGGKRSGGLRRGEKTTLVSDATKILVEEMQKAGVKRLVCMSNVGAGDSERYVPWVLRKLIVPVVAPFLTAIVEDKNRMELLVMQSGLDWTLVRLPGIMGDKPKGTRRVALDGPVGMAIRVPDCAQFLVEQLADRSYVGKAPSVSN